jgi:hypothetical protein
MQRMVRTEYTLLKSRATNCRENIAEDPLVQIMIERIDGARIVPRSRENPTGDYLYIPDDDETAVLMAMLFT